MLFDWNRSTHVGQIKDIFMETTPTPPPETPPNPPAPTPTPPKPPSEKPPKFKDDSSDADMVKIIQATRELNGWRKRMKAEYECEDWHLLTALDSFLLMLNSAATCEEDED